MPESKSNVVPFPGARPREIALASVHSPGVRVTGSRNTVWLCPAYAGAHERMLYVKPHLNVRQIVAELLCAQVAHAMGLPTPTPHLVAVAPHNVGLPRGPSLLAFGSQQMGPRASARFITDLDVLFESLSKAKALAGLCVLDEWAANSVRHERDLLFYPAGDIWIIDHESALPTGVAPDAYVTNWLADRLRESTEPHKRSDMLRTLRAKASALSDASVTSAPEELRKLERAVETWRDVSQFLLQRLDQLGHLLQQRVTPNQPSLLPAEPTMTEQRREPN